MGYLSDWREAEEAMVAAHAAHPDCDGTLNCPAVDHLVDCKRYRHERQTQRGKDA